MMLIRLAWRNLWRNRRRSLIVLASIVIGVSATDFLVCFARAFMVQMLETQLGSHTAHVQIHARGFQDNRVVQNFMSTPAAAESALAVRPDVRAWSKRLVTTGLLSSAGNSSGVLLVGIEPEREARVTTIRQYLVEGRYLETDPHAIVLSARLARTLGVGVGERVVALATSADGKVGSEMFRVAGLYRSPSLAFDKMTVYVPLPTAQAMVRVGDRIAEIAVLARDAADAGGLKTELEALTGPGYEVLSYRELLPSLIAQTATMEKIMGIFYLLIGLAMVFGIVNTMLMSVFERVREIGVLKSIGMEDARIFAMIELEAFFLGVVGAGIGVAVSFAVNGFLARTGINLAMFAEGLSVFGLGAVVYPVLNVWSTVQETAVVLGVCLGAAVYPAFRAVRLEPVEALHYL